MASWTPGEQSRADWPPSCPGYGEVLGQIIETVEVVIQPDTQGP